MKKNKSNLLQATILAVILLAVCCAAAYAGIRTTKTLFIPTPQAVGPEELTIDNPDIVSITRADGGFLLSSLRAGQATVAMEDQILALIDCAENGFMSDSFSRRYTGDTWVHGAILAFLAGTVIILALALRRQVKQSFYHYATPLLAGLLLLVCLMLLLLCGSLMLSRNTPLEDAMADLPFSLLFLTLPILVVFALAMFISNISLLRHEGRTWRNLLGSIIGLALSIAALVILLFSNASGSLDEVHIQIFFTNLFSGIVLWMMCKLAGIILCGILAAKNQPAMDKDYVLILGCKLSRKGGLTPLLRGRVDRALQFARQQEQTTGHMPILVPCGGKGKDELRSEAAAMREYLLEQGVPDEGILAEDRSENTWENLRNAKAMMKPGAKVAFSTTNYHVFRAGVWAARNDLPADGMGSKTKWYYWPNAFMREYVALMTANLPHELLMLAAISIQSGLLAYLYH